MIYVTGDTHANIDIAKLNTTKFPQQKELTKNDFVIICGDFGLCWDASRDVVARLADSEKLHDTLD
mgnify:CR=1 FL=1